MNERPSQKPLNGLTPADLNLEVLARVGHMAALEAQRAARRRGLELVGLPVTPLSDNLDTVAPDGSTSHDAPATDQPR